MQEIMFEISVPKVRRRFKLREILISSFIVVMILFDLLPRILIIVHDEKPDKIFNLKTEIKILLSFYASLLFLFLTTGLVLLYLLKTRYNYEFRLQKNTILLFLFTEAIIRLIRMMTLYHLINSDSDNVMVDKDYPMIVYYSGLTTSI